MVGQSNIQHCHHWKPFYRKLRILTPKGGSGEYLAEMRACARLKEPGSNRVPATGHLDTIQAHFPRELRASHKWYSLGTTWPTDFCKSPKLGWPPPTPFPCIFLLIGSDPATPPATPFPFIFSRLEVTPPHSHNPHPIWNFSKNSWKSIVQVVP